MSKKRKRTAGVNIRLTDYERKRIQSKSKKCGLSMSEYIRQTALGSVPKSILPEEIEEIISTAIQIPLMEWYRKSELTADRAGLLACQNPDAAYTLLTKISGYPMKYYNSINKDDILEQARSFEDLDSNSFNKVAKAMSILFSDHPWTVLRAKELDKWISSKKYNILQSKSKRLYHRLYKK